MISQATPAQPETLVRRMGSLADPTRLRLLRLLERHEVGVADLCAALQMPQSTVSRHLKVLLDQGWVASRRQGTTNLYRLATDGFEDAARGLWALAREQTDGWATLQQDRLRLGQRLQHRRQRSRDFFEDAARQWDQTRQQMYGESFAHAAMLGLLPRDWTVVDIGCGTGLMTAELARHVRQVIGVDNAEAMLDAARHRTAELPNVELRHGDAEALPLDDTTADAAMMALVLTYLPDPMPALCEARRVLTPGGRLVVVDLLPHDRDDFRHQMGQVCLGFDPTELTGLAEAAGFDAVTVRPLPPDPDARGPALQCLVADAADAVDAPASAPDRAHRAGAGTRAAKTRTP